jgi:hypothetical protein
MNYVFAKHGLNACVVTYVKDEGSNLFTITFTFIFVMSCEVLRFFVKWVS